MSTLEFVPSALFVIGVGLYRLAKRRADIAPDGRSKWILLLGSIAAYAASGAGSLVVLAQLITRGDI